MAKVGDGALCKHCETPLTRVKLDNRLQWAHRYSAAGHKGEPKRGTVTPREHLYTTARKY